jgi:hypothetical protein
MHSIFRRLKKLFGVLLFGVAAFLLVSFPIVSALAAHFTASNFGHPR